MGLFGSHTGSWSVGPVKLPDFGLTEMYSNLIGAPRNYQGGSQLSNVVPTYVSNQQQTSPTNAMGPLYGPNVPAVNNFSAQSTTTSPLGGGGGDVLGMTAPPVTQQTGSSGPDYSNYYSQLDAMMGNLSGQASNLTNIAQQQAAQQQANLDLQNQQGQQQLNQYQAKSLKDIGSTLRSGFQAGNNLLGSMGAADSSAANQYAYALAKEGSQQRGNVMADVASRMGNLNQVYNTAKNNLQSALSAKVSEIAQWFSEQQNALQGQKADVAKQQSDQALAYAMQQLGVVQQQAAGMQNALNTWVANNATSIQQAQTQMAQNVANNPIPMALNTAPVTSAGTTPAVYGGGTTDFKNNSLFNTPQYSWLTGR